MPNITVYEGMGEKFEIRKAEPDNYPEIEKIFIAQGLENNKTGVEILKGYTVEVLNSTV